MSKEEKHRYGKSTRNLTEKMREIEAYFQTEYVGDRNNRLNEALFALSEVVRCISAERDFEKSIWFEAKDIFRFIFSLVITCSVILLTVGLFINLNSYVIQPINNLISQTSVDKRVDLVFIPITFFMTLIGTKIFNKIFHPKN